MSDLLKLPKPVWPAPRQPTAKCQVCGIDRNRLVLRTDAGGVRRCLTTCWDDTVDAVPSDTPRRRERVA